VNARAGAAGLVVAAAGMLAKQRREGKRGNILLAMPQARLSMDRISFCKIRRWPPPYAERMADKL
jgi:hypothetical protein